jgi:hypothetical protein
MNRISGTTREEKQEDGENCIMRSFVFYIPHQILL